VEREAFWRDDTSGPSERPRQTVFALPHRERRAGRRAATVGHRGAVSDGIPLEEGCRVTVCVVTGRRWTRNNSAVMRPVVCLVSTHAILRVQEGEFVSLLDPPAHWKAHADACRNVGAFPVLAGEQGGKDVMLASPIILYDHPQVAPESPGDLFDATEIDEILTCAF
jgi:hypothetical protein